jgi:hypothetical protein
MEPRKENLMTEGKGILENIFDFSFSEFVTPKIIKILFVLGIVIAAAMTVMLIVTTFMQSVVAGLIVLILSPIVFGLYVLAARIWCELIVVAFSIADNTRRMAGDIAKGPAQQ